MKAKIENGILHLEWYREGGRYVFSPITHDPYITALSGIIEKLALRVDELERGIKSATTRVGQD